MGERTKGSIAFAIKHLWSLFLDIDYKIQLPLYLCIKQRCLTSSIPRKKYPMKYLYGLEKEPLATKIHSIKIKNKEAI